MKNVVDQGVILLPKNWAGLKVAVLDGEEEIVISQVRTTSITDYVGLDLELLRKDLAENYVAEDQMIKTVQDDGRLRIGAEYDARTYSINHETIDEISCLRVSFE